MSTSVATLRLSGQHDRNTWSSSAEYAESDFLSVSDLLNSPVDIKAQFFSMLKSCFGNEFDEDIDRAYFGLLLEEYTDIDILAEFEKKIAWWDKNPKALHSPIDPYQQLDDWFKKAREYKGGKKA